jgi:hypothetical protein
MRSAITQLRDSVPLRRLSTAEALRVAEAQANRLLRLSGQTEPPVSEEIIAALPGVEIQRVRCASAPDSCATTRGRHPGPAACLGPPHQLYLERICAPERLAR